MITVSRETERAIRLISNLDDIQDTLIEILNIAGTPEYENKVYNDTEVFVAPLREYIQKTISDLVITACYQKPVTSI